MLCEPSKVLRALGRDIVGDIIGISLQVSPVLWVNFYNSLMHKDFFSSGRVCRIIFSPCNVLFLGLIEGAWFFSGSGGVHEFFGTCILTKYFFQSHPTSSESQMIYLSSFFWYSVAGIVVHTLSTYFFYCNQVSGETSRLETTDVLSCP